MEHSDISTKASSSFKAEAMKEVVKRQWKDDKTRINDEATDVMIEVARKLTVEVATRAANQARIQNELLIKVVEVQHVEKIIPQILMDF